MYFELFVLVLILCLQNKMHAKHLTRTKGHPQRRWEDMDHTLDTIQGKPRRYRADGWLHLQARLQELIGSGDPHPSHLALKDPHISITSTYKSEPITTYKWTNHLTQLNQTLHTKEHPTQTNVHHNLSHPPNLSKTSAATLELLRKGTTTFPLSSSKKVCSNKRNKPLGSDCSHSVV